MQQYPGFVVYVGKKELSCCPSSEKRRRIVRFWDMPAFEVISIGVSRIWALCWESRNTCVCLNSTQNCLELFKSLGLLAFQLICIRQEPSGHVRTKCLPSCWNYCSCSRRCRCQSWQCWRTKNHILSLCWFLFLCLFKRRPHRVSRTVAKWFNWHKD